MKIPTPLLVIGVVVAIVGIAYFNRPNPTDSPLRVALDASQKGQHRTAVWIWTLVVNDEDRSLEKEFFIFEPYYRATARLNLAIHYSRQADPPDYVEALFWLILASDWHPGQALQEARIITRKMTSAQIAQAEQAALARMTPEMRTSWEKLGREMRPWSTQ